MARLNTRERLTATWFERTAQTPLAFTHEIWRMKLKEEAAEERGKALLAIISSSSIAFLINLFSTNNHVSKDDLGRVPVPEKALPLEQLAWLANSLLAARCRLEDFIRRFDAKLPPHDEGAVYIPPARFNAATLMPKLTVEALLGRGEMSNNGPATGRIKALKAKGSITCTIASTEPHAAAFAEIVELFFTAPEQENDTWSQAQTWLLPDPIASLNY